MSASLCTAEALPVAAQDASVRIRVQKCLHQRCEAWLFRFFPRLHLQGIVYLRQQLAAFPAGQKTVVADHLKMIRRYVADIASDHLFLGRGQQAVLLRTVVVIVIYQGATAVVPELRRRSGIARDI